MEHQLQQLFIRQSFSMKETIHPNELSSIDSQDYDNSINSIILDKIKNKIGNRCNQHGYVDKDTISLVTRSAGCINTTHFNGDMHFNVIVQANICYPTEGNMITCKVIGTNKERFSIPFFFNPQYDTIISDKRNLLAGEYLSQRYDETYVHKIT